MNRHYFFMDAIRLFALGLMLGVMSTVIIGGAWLLIMKSHFKITGIVDAIQDFNLGWRHKVFEDFSKPIPAMAAKAFGAEGQLTFELFRDGTFVIDGESGYAWQKSPSYRDSAFIRSTQPLPDRYKISVSVGEIDYDLSKIQALKQDAEYPEGPRNENGVYLLSITDEAPEGHHTNIWWHQHRKLVVDVDNNVWGHGMPNPIFMVYFDKGNGLVSFDGKQDSWVHSWEKAVTYDPKGWYQIEVEKTKKFYIFRIKDARGNRLKEAKIKRDQVWHDDEDHEEYFVVGDPHENYYQGSFKINSIGITTP